MRCRLFSGFFLNLVRPLQRRVLFEPNAYATLERRDLLPRWSVGASKCSAGAPAGRWMRCAYPPTTAAAMTVAV